MAATAQSDLCWQVLGPNNMKTKVILLAIILFGFALRAWQVGSVPTILNRDEAALAYNAFLLKQTGTDEWGQKWPVALESFGDYKLIGYPLFLIGSFTLFGYNDVAVKLPSVLAGTVLIWLGYLFVKKIVKFDETLSLLAAFFIAIQPVFFFYSRIAFEANVALSLFIGGIILLFGYRSLLAKVTAIILFFCAVFTYNTPLLLLPFLLPALLYWYGWKNWRTWLLPVVGAMIVLVLGAGSLLSLSKQKSGITIFSDELLWEQSVKYHLQFSGVVQKIVGNRIVFYSGVLLGNYVKSFTPIFLVFRGGPHPWHQLPGFGHVYGTVYVLGWVGILSAVWFFIQQARKKKSLPKMETTLLFLLFISPLPSAVTVDAPHATRTLLFLFLFVIFAIYGIKKIVEKTKKISMKSILVLLLVFIIL